VAIFDYTDFKFYLKKVGAKVDNMFKGIYNSNLNFRAYLLGL